MELALVALDGLLGLRVGLVGVVKSNLKLVDVALQLLLDPKALSLGALLGFQAGLHAFHGTLVVLAGIVELFLLLGHPAVNLLSDLSKLKLGPQDLVLFSLKGALGLLKSSLELLLRVLLNSSSFVQFMDGAATITKLIKEILDLISQVLVLTPNNVKLLIGLIQGSLKTEAFGVEVA